MDVFLNNKINKLNKDIMTYGRINFSIKQGYIIQPDGNEYVNGSYWVSDFISVEELSCYAVNFNVSMRYYDFNKSILSSGSANQTSFLTPYNSAYIRLYGLVTDLLNPTANMVLSEGTIVKNVSDLNILKTNIDINFIQGKIVQPDGNAYDNVDYYATDFVKLTPGDIYSINFISTLRFYDINKTYVTFSNVSISSFKVPSNVYFVKFTNLLTNLLNPVGSMTLVKGSKVLSIEDCSLKIRNTDTSKKYWISGKNVCFYGDSITQQNYFPTYLNKKMNFWKSYNQGIGGTSVANNGKYSNVSADGLIVYNIDVPSDYTPSQGIVIPSNFCMQSRINLIPSDTEVIIVMGGTNDYGQNVTVGDFTYPYLDTTFCGALMLMIQRIKAKIPNAEIFVCSPIYANNSGGNTNLTSPQTNAQSKTIIDYGDLVKRGCELTSTNYLPVGETSGLAFYNIESNLQDGVHPSQTTGALKIANAIYSKIKNYEILT